MLKLILSLPLLLYLTWGAYLLIMHLKVVRDAGKLTLAAKVLGYPWLAVGLVLDIIFNVVIGSLIFLERPREWLFTSRVSRWNDEPGRRGSLARWICVELLDPFDAGGHCE